MSSKLDNIEKLFKNQYSENIIYISEKKKTISNIEDLEQQIKTEEITKDDYKIIKPLRNLSLFSNKCKYCKQAAIKEIDNTYYIKYKSCYKCFVINEEFKHE